MGVSNHRPEIDGLRAVAVIPVVLFHFGLGMSGGWVGVDVFFVISGFLITSLILRGLDDATFSLKDFWERRARRILPAALSVMLASLVAGWILLSPHDYLALGESAASQTVFLSNFYFWQTSGYFSAPSELKPLLHTWSLAVEEQFYIFLPLLLLFLWKKGTKSILKILWVLMIASFVVSSFGVKHFPDAAFYLLPTRAWELLVGAVLAGFGGMNAGVQNRRLAEIFGWGGLVLILGPMFFYTPTTPFPGPAAIPPCLGAAFIILSSGKVKPVIASILSDKRVVFIGWISYSLYLWHWPLIVFAKRAMGTGELALTSRLLLLLASFAIATLSWQYIEKPFRYRKFFRETPAFAKATVGALGLLFAMGIAISSYRGMPSRFPAELQQYAEGRNDIDPRRKDTHNLKAELLKRNGIPLLSMGESEDAGPELLVWGDSHCASIIPVVRLLCEENLVQAYAATQDSTIPLLETYKAEQPESYFRDYNEAMFAFAAEKKVKHVLLVGKWSACINPRSRDRNAIARSLLRGGSLDEGDDHTSEHSQKVFEEAFRDTLKRLQGASCRVWVLEEVPQQDGMVPNMLMDAVLGGKDPSLVGIPLDHHLNQTKEIRNIFSNVGASQPVTYLNPVPYFSMGGDLCLAASEGRALYSDDNHLSVAGAMQLRPLFQSLVAEICSGRSSLVNQ